MSNDSQQNFKSKYELLFVKIIENPIIGLSILAIIGIIIRAVYYPYELPLVFDSLMYFWYANDMSIIGGFPTNYSFPNNGWPTILSLFFSMYNSENFSRLYEHSKNNYCINFSFNNYSNFFNM